MKLRRPSGVYTGPVCFVSPDTDIAHEQQGIEILHTGYSRRLRGGHKRRFTPLKKGWHYSLRESYKPVLTEVKPGIWKTIRVKDLVPDRPLHLNDSDPQNLFYEYAENHHRSWVEKHGHGNIKVIGG